jgi:NADH dehydrogenase [ubiquinone] 1 alpha subcomplex assembly factor 1
VKRSIRVLVLISIDEDVVAQPWPETAGSLTAITIDGGDGNGQNGSSIFFDDGTWIQPRARWCRPSALSVGPPPTRSAESGCPPLGWVPLPSQPIEILVGVSVAATAWIIDRIVVAGTPFTTIEQFAVNHLDLIDATLGVVAIGGWILTSQHVRLSRVSNRILCKTRITGALVAGLVLTAACGTDSDSSAATDPSDSTPTTSEAVATTTDTPDVTIPESSCRRISDSDGSGGGSDSFIVNDGVMGGGSISIIDIGDSVMRFSGTVVTNGGGFTSVRYRMYGITLEDEAAVGRRPVSHRAELDTTGATDDHGWTVATLDYTELRPSIFGQQVDAAPFNPDAAREIGIIIADGRDGNFSLDVDWIDVCD